MDQSHVLLAVTIAFLCYTNSSDISLKYFVVAIHQNKVSMRDH